MFRFILVLFLGLCLGKYICGDGSAIDRAKDEERFLRALTKTGRILERMWNAIEEPSANAREMAPKRFEKKSETRQWDRIENATEESIERLGSVWKPTSPVDRKVSSKGLVVLKPGQVLDPDTGALYRVPIERSDSIVLRR